MSVRMFITAVALCWPSSSGAFGLKAHLWIAEQVWQDLADCSLDIGGLAFPLPLDRCEKFAANREEFMAGALGPDVFPDLVIGQVVIHPGVQGGFQASDWLTELLERADKPEELAFSWGYATHYAGDVFAHTYVNNYAGGVFDLLKGGTPNIERRHFLLEKYIDQKLDFRYDVRRLRVPAAFLGKVLVRRDYVSGQGLPKLPTVHMRTLQRALALAMRVRDFDAPKLVSKSKDRLGKKLERLARVEDRLGVRRSAGVPFDRRSADVRHVSGPQREWLRKAHTDYQHAVDRLRRDEALLTMARQWAEDVEGSGDLYIVSSLGFASSMLLQSGSAPVPYPARVSPLQPYRDWFACYSPTLRGGSLLVGHATCDRLKMLGASIDYGDAAFRAFAGRGAGAVYDAFGETRRYLLDVSARAALKAAGKMDADVAALAEELADPALVDQEALDEAFSEAPNGQLLFDCIVDWIDADLGLRSTAPVVGRRCDGAPRIRATMDPMSFRPLAYAVVLAKLSLLDEATLKDLVVRFEGDPAQMTLSPHKRYSVLIDMVKSLDGSQQWSALSLPAPRQHGFPRKVKHVSAGYGLPTDQKRGFPLYQTAALRAGPFKALFPKAFEGAILERPEMRWPAYPFRPCEGDHLRGEPVGEAEVVC